MKLAVNSKFISVIVAGLLMTSALHASFEPLAVGGRAAGMGEATSAIVDDVYSLYYNPAGLLQMERPEVGSYYSKLYPGLSDSSQISRLFLGYAQPLKKKTNTYGLGVSYSALELSSLYKEETLGFSFAKEVRQRWNAGGTLKLLKKNIGSDAYTGNAINPENGATTGAADPVFASGHSKTALAADVGVQYQMARAFALGGAIRNLNAPNMALGSTEDKAPAVYTLALARRLRMGSLDVEFLNWKNDMNRSRLNLGGEHWFKNGFGLRAGAGFGSQNYSTLSFGASFKTESFQFDYATVLPLQGIEGTTGVQQVSFTVRLGKPPVDAVEKQLMKEKEQRIKAEIEARNALTERDRLKKQIIDLTESKTTVFQKERPTTPKASIIPVVKTENNQAAKLVADYNAALTSYNVKVQEGANLEERRKMLEKIMNQFGASNVDLSTAKRELKSLKLEETRAKNDFDLSMNFYQRLAGQGASQEERKAMLQRIIQKYQGMGIDISSAEEEMQKIK